MKWVLVILALTSSAFAACHAVGPTAAGSGNGSNWSNRMTMPGTGSFVRGDVYYLMDGSYPAIDFNQSGTAAVELRKAQSYDFGRTSDGCSNDISSGWNASTMGASQAVFSQLYFGHMFYIESPGLVINGNGQQSAPGCGGAVGNDPTAAPTIPTDCGIKIDNSTAQTTDLITTPVAAAWTIKYVEIRGSGNATTENFVMRQDGTTGSLISHIYLHYFGAVAVVAGGTTNLEIVNSYFFRAQAVLGSNPGHGQGIEIGASSSGGNIHNNVWRDMSGTCAIATFLASGTSTGWKFYDNIVWNTSGYTPSFMSDGIIACINNHVCNSTTFVQNTIASFRNTANGPPNVSVEIEAGGSVNVENNIWYNNATMPVLPATEDHNSYLANGTGCPTGTGDVCNNAASSPFSNWQAGDFTLPSDSSNVNNRVSLAAPYTTDMTGVTFTTDRGTLQFVSTSVPLLTTTTASSITTTSASSGGTVTSNNGFSVTAEGVCWATTPNPVVGGTCTSDGTSTPFTSSLTGLTSGTLYHYRSYATNSQGTGYGSDLTFSTLGPQLTVSPTAIDFGTQNLNSASSGHVITISNPGTASATISSITGYANGFAQSASTCGTLPATLTASGSCTVTVTFTPTSAGSKSATLTVTDTPDSLSATSSFTGVGFDNTAINIVQTVACGPQTFPGTCTIAANGVGNVIVVVFNSYNTAGAACAGGVTGCAMTSITDNATGGSNTYTEVPNTKSTDTGTDALSGAQTSWNDMFWSKTTHAGATTITITPNTSGTGDVYIWEISNVSTVNASNSLSSQAASSSPVSPTLTISSSKAATVAYLHPSSSCGGAVGILAGNAFINDSLNDNMAWAHLITSSAGSAFSQWSTQSCVYASGAAAFAGNGPAYSHRVTGMRVFGGVVIH